MPEGPDIERDDIDRERARLEANVEEFPELALLLDDLPDDYDPLEPVERRDDGA